MRATAWILPGERLLGCHLPCSTHRLQPWGRGSEAPTWQARPLQCPLHPEQPLCRSKSGPLSLRPGRNRPGPGTQSVAAFLFPLLRRRAPALPSDFGNRPLCCSSSICLADIYHLLPNKQPPRRLKPVRQLHTMELRAVDSPGASEHSPWGARTPGSQGSGPWVQSELATGWATGVHPAFRATRTVRLQRRQAAVHSPLGTCRCG